MRVALATVVVAAASSPGHAVPADVRGIEVDEEPDDPTVARVLLYPLKLTVQIVAAPVRGGAWVVERYQLRDRLLRLLFSEDGTLGIYPTALIETEFGLNVGIHVVDNDLAGHHERLALAFGFGGEWKQRYDATLTSGALLQATRVSLRVGYRAWDRSNFFGIGNADLGADAVHTRFAQRAAHAELQAMTPLIGPASLEVTGAYTRRRFSNDAELDGYAPTLAVYDEMALTGFAGGAESFFGEVSALVDSRAVANRYVSNAAPSYGWWAHAGVGFAQGISGDPSHYVRYHADVRRYIDLYGGDRVLIVRGFLDGVTAPLDDIPFSDLPRIGGTELLRGFSHDRFRDRVAALGSLEYDFPVQTAVGAYLFADAGRVGSSIANLGISGVHLGYGGGLQFQTLDAFLFRLQIAHSSEGTFLRFALEPTYDLRAKNRRL